VLDEGGVIGDGILPGVSAPIALEGIAEKGFSASNSVIRGQGATHPFHHNKLQSGS
jgi:carboxypeptidase PM20D1